MTHPAPPLGAQIASLRTAALAQERCVLLPARLHALIIACFARIFDRLEALLLAWQSGTLPIPTPRIPSQPADHQAAEPAPLCRATPSTVARQNSVRAPNADAASRRDQHVQAPSRAQPATTETATLARPMPSRPRLPARVPHPARAPPPPNLAANPAMARRATAP